MHPLTLPTYLPRELGGTATTTILPTTSSPASTNISKATSGAGPTSSPLLFIVLVSVFGTLLFIFLGVAAYCCATRKGRVVAREQREAAARTQAHELQPTAPGAQPAPSSEVYGYYAPRGEVTVKGKAEEQAAAREVYGYFSPNIAPRIGDVVVARPGA